MSIKDNCSLIIEKILEAEKRAGRPENSVKLMAVSKFHPAEAVLEAYSAGLKLFGENRVQEAAAKFSPLLQTHSDIELHLIGSLQRNKVKQILPYVSCIQSVDRIELIDEIAKQKQKDENKAHPLKLLFEVHTGEESKSRFTDEAELCSAIEKAASLKDLNIECSGFMTMAPFTDDKNLIRASFRKLSSVADRAKTRFPELPLTELSMGMSHDFEIAIEEGSTLVRIGTALFGERSYV